MRGKIVKSLTVVSHVEGGETGVGVAEHGINGGVAVNSTPAAAGLPHAVEDSAYLERIVPILHHRRVSLLGDLNRRPLAAPHHKAARAPRPPESGGRARGEWIGDEVVHRSCGSRHS